MAERRDERDDVVVRLEEEASKRYAEWRPGPLRFLLVEASGEIRRLRAQVTENSPEKVAELVERLKNVRGIGVDLYDQAGDALQALQRENAEMREALTQIGKLDIMLDAPMGDEGRLDMATHIARRALHAHGVEIPEERARTPTDSEETADGE